MSRGVNKAIILGNLGGDPELRYSSNDKAVCNFTVATSEEWTRDGEKQQKTEWHRCTAFGRLGEVCNDLLTKGSKVYIEGKIRTRKWQDNNGLDRYTTEIILDEMQLLDKRSQSGHDSTNIGRDSANIGNDFDDGIPF